jgi:hypothetical protein
MPKIKKPEPASKEQFLLQFKSAMESCLLLDDADKQYWLENAEKIPMDVLRNVYREVQKKNKSVEKFIKTALENDPDHLYLAELKNKVAKLKRNTKEMAEKAGETEPENILKQME